MTLEEYYSRFSKEELEKAKELGQKYFPNSENIWERENIEQQRTIIACLEIAEWKEQQFQEEKKQLIEKACKEHCNCCGYAYMACRRYNYDNLHCRHYIKFKQAMEELVMSRQEEIVQAANENYPSLDYEKSYEGFKDGAKWADKHPRKGLWDADKVIEWIKSNEIYYEHDDVDIFVDDLRKAMEE